MIKVSNNNPLFLDRLPRHHYNWMTMKQETSKIEHFISIQDLDKDGLINLIDLALDIKSNRTRPSIDGKSLALLFEKP